MQTSFIASFALAITTTIASPVGLADEKSFDNAVTKLARGELTSRAPKPYVYIQSIADTVTCDEYPDLADIEIPYHHQKFFGPVNISVTCWTRGRPHPINRPDQMTTTYLKDYGWGCYMHESQFVGGLGGDTDWEEDYGIPECREKLRPWQVWSVTDKYTSDKYSIYQDCWKCPSLNCPVEKFYSIKYRVRCWVDGQKTNGTSRWYEGAHLVGANETERCYVPGDIRKELIWASPGSGQRCPDWDEAPAIPSMAAREEEGYLV